MMKNGTFLAGFLSFALVSVASAQSTVAPAGDGDHYTKSQLNKMVQEAHTPEQYEALASYYGQQQENYHQKAKEVHHEWVRQWSYNMSRFAKYPAPADSARNLYQDYVKKAAEAGAFFEKYSQLAQPAGPAMQQRM